MQVLSWHKALLWQGMQHTCSRMSLNRTGALTVDAMGSKEAARSDRSTTCSKIDCRETFTLCQESHAHTACSQAAKAAMQQASYRTHLPSASGRTCCDASCPLFHCSRELSGSVNAGNLISSGRGGTSIPYCPANWSCMVSRASLWSIDLR